MSRVITDTLLVTTTAYVYMSTVVWIVDCSWGNPAQYGIRFWEENTPPKYNPPKKYKSIVPMLYEKPQLVPSYRTGPGRIKQKPRQKETKFRFFAEDLPKLISDLLTTPVYQKPRLISKVKVQRKKFSPFMLPLMYERDGYGKRKRRSTGSSDVESKEQVPNNGYKPKDDDKQHENYIMRHLDPNSGRLRKKLRELEYTLLLPKFKQAIKES